MPRPCAFANLKALPFHGDGSKKGLSRGQGLAGSSGITRVSPTTVMKLVSPFQRGTTCRWMWSATPAPAEPPEVHPQVDPVGPVDLREDALHLARQGHHLAELLGGGLGQASRRGVAARP